MRIAVGGMGRMVYLGVDVAAVSAAIDARRPPASRRWELLDQVTQMGEAYAQALNERRNG